MKRSAMDLRQEQPPRYKVRLIAPPRSPRFAAIGPIVALGRLFVWRNGTRELVGAARRGGASRGFEGRAGVAAE